MNSETIEIFKWLILLALGGVSAFVMGKGILRKDRSQAAEAQVNVIDHNRLSEEIEYSKKLAAEMRVLSEKVASLTSSVIAIAGLLEAMVLCDKCRDTNATFMKKIAVQLRHHVPEEKVPHEPSEMLDPEVKRRVDEFLAARGSVGGQ